MLKKRRKVQLKFRKFTFYTLFSLLSLLKICCNNFSSGGVKIIAYFASAVIAVSSNSCVDPSPRIKITLFLLSMCTDQLIPAPKQKIFFSKLLSVIKYSERESNPMRQLLYLYLSGSAFLVSFRDPNYLI